MNPELPPPFPGQPPLPPAPQSPPPKKPPHFGRMFALGVVLNLVSFGLCFLAQNPWPFYLVGLIAFVLVFYRAYQVIFVGFVATIGVVLLLAAITCGAIIVMHK